VVALKDVAAVVAAADVSVSAFSWLMYLLLLL
jgi:hypothetical protein